MFGTQMSAGPLRQGGIEDLDPAGLARFLPLLVQSVMQFSTPTALFLEQLLCVILSGSRGGWKELFLNRLGFDDFFAQNNHAFKAAHLEAAWPWPLQSSVVMSPDPLLLVFVFTLFWKHLGFFSLFPEIYDDWLWVGLFCFVFCLHPFARSQ